MLRRRGAELGLIVLAAAALGACAGLGRPGPAASAGELPAAAEGRSGSAARVIEFANSLREFEDAELAGLGRVLELQTREAPSSEAALRLALLLSYPESPDYDLERAINLLNQVARTRRAEDPVYASFAELLATFMIERRTIATDRASLREQARASSARIEALEAELEQARSALAEAEARSRQLQGQLDALIELEEQLNGAGARPADGDNDAE